MGGRPYNQAIYFGIAFEAGLRTVQQSEVRSGLHCVSLTLRYAQTDLKKSLVQCIRSFNIDAQGFRKTKNENPPTWEIRVTR